MMCGKDFGRGVYVGMLFEESANVTSQRPVFGLPGRIQRKRRLPIGMAYLLPPRFAFGGKGWKRGLASRDGDGLFVGVTVCVRYLVTSFVTQPRPQFN